MLNKEVVKVLVVDSEYLFRKVSKIVGLNDDDFGTEKLNYYNEMITIYNNFCKENNIPFIFSNKTYDYYYTNH